MPSLSVWGFAKQATLIKVNLLRNINGGQTAAAPSAGSNFLSGESETVVKQLAAVKALSLLVPTILLFGIEKYNISILTQKLNSTNEQVAKVEQNIRAFGDTGPMLEKYTTIKAKLEKQFDALQAIGNNRLREVKTLDSLQTIIPARNWINDLIIDEKGVVALNGFSETPDGAFSFVKAIEENPNFSDVSKVNVSTNAAQPGSKEPGLKKFSFEFRIGKAK